jgi:hypothetical protein
MRCDVCLAVLWVAVSGCGCDRAKPAPARAAAAQATQHKPGKYAVLANADTSSDHRGNITRAYRALRALGFEEKNIFVISPRDRRHPVGKATPLLTPVPSHFAEIMDRLARTTEAGDLVVIYGTGHGDRCDRGAFLAMRRGEIWPADLRAQVDRLGSDTVIILDQCFSGGFTGAFEGTKRKVIVITDVDAAHETYCAYFARAFWDSFLHPHDADRNRDGKTSVREAFDAALKVHQRELAGDPDVKTDGTFRSFNGFDDALLN